MGNAITEKQHAEDIKIILDVGANSVRLAHYQQNSYFYDLCDESGLLVWAEVPVISRFSPKRNENAEQQLVELIKQNYNHPSIFCWGIENEITIAGSANKKLITFLKHMHKVAKHLDPTRYTTCAQLTMCPVNSPLNHITDIIGYNHYYGWYMGSCDEINNWLDEWHRENPEGKLCLSEYGAEGITKYHSDSPVQGDYSEDYQAIYHEHYIKAINERDWLWGSYVWNMFDFGSASRNEGGVRGRNNKGLVTFDRKTKKDAFWLYKAYWSDKKFVHITAQDTSTDRRKEHNKSLLQLPGGNARSKRQDLHEESGQSVRLRRYRFEARRKCHQGARRQGSPVAHNNCKRHRKKPLTNTKCPQNTPHSYATGSLRRTARATRTSSRLRTAWVKFSTTARSTR